LLHGFSIGGFRNFSGDPQWVGPLGSVNVFIGTNNSGKSNVLRYIRRHLSPLIGEPDIDDIDRSIDEPQSGEKPPFTEILLPFENGEKLLKKTGAIAKWPDNWTNALREFVVLDGRFLKIPISNQRHGSPEFFGKIPGNVDRIDRSAFSGLWQTFVNRGGGGSFEGHWYSGTMDYLTKEACQTKIQPHYIRAFRQITTRLPEFTDEYTKDHGEHHLIDELDKIANPSWNKDHLRNDFAELQNFMRVLLDDDQISIDIPNNNKTINVRSSHSYVPIEALGSGIHEAFLLAAAVVLRKDETILLEEPEVHLHPALQKKLMHFLLKRDQGQIFITTHSASIIDVEGVNVFHVSSEAGQAKIHPIITEQQRHRSCSELGYRASELVQANFIVWVEGPSDRVYLNAWLSQTAPDLIEGQHYSIMFYGGKLLSHLSMQHEAVEEFVRLLPICRQAAILIDSDRSKVREKLRETKQRIISEVQNNGGFCWVTCGREIENYYSIDDRQTAISAVHKNFDKLCEKKDKFSKPIDFTRTTDRKKKITADKMKLARYLVQHSKVDESMKKHKTHVNTLIKHIRDAN
jgi:hypothetical protein